MSANEIAIPEDFEKVLREAALKEKQSIPDASSTISTKNKSFSLGGNQLGDSIDVVVVASIMEHAYYDRPYNQNNPSPPVCFAIEDEKGDMIPHENSPSKQAKTCRECEHNEFGSAATGEGKACKNSRRLAVMAYGTEGVDKSELAVLKLAPTSLKNFSKFSKTITTAYKRPTFAVITNLRFDPLFQYSVVVPTLVQPINDSQELQVILESREAAIEMISEPYDTSNYEEPSSQPKKKSKMS